MYARIPCELAADPFGSAKHTLPATLFWLLNLLKPTGYVMHQQFNIQQLYALPTLYLCAFLFISEQTATCATYSINWLVFIAQFKSVYSAVRTGSLNKAVCALYLSENKQRLVPLTA